MKNKDKKKKKKKQRSKDEKAKSQKLLVQKLICPFANLNINLVKSTSKLAFTVEKLVLGSQT